MSPEEVAALRTIADEEGTVLGHDLAGWAAEEAVKTLLENWGAFVRDGGELTDALHDVDDVCAALKRWESAVWAHLARQRTGGP